MYDPEAKPRPLIFGCAGLTLCSEERNLFADGNPYGFILFDRNIENPAQVRRLVHDLRCAVGRQDAPILIDQEGGRVARLKPPHWWAAPAAGNFELSLGSSEHKAREAIFINSQIVAHELSELGISVDCMPVLDLSIDTAHQVIGNRSYSAEPNRVEEFGRAACLGLLSGGVLPVIKHIPGHGRAPSDSHVSLPVVEARWEELVRTDFVPFKRLSSMPMAMTGHVLYSSIDPRHPATTSPLVIADIIRGEIGFEGLLMTDDICMSALEGSPVERAEEALSAGCDLVLHCNGQFDEMVDISRRIGVMAHSSWNRTVRANEFLEKKVPAFDLALAKRKLAALLG